MERTLRLIFRDEERRNTTMSVSDPHDELNSVSADVESAMDFILSSDVFEISGGSIVGKIKAEVVSREVEAIPEF